jgi:hypothetical protein
MKIRYRTLALIAAPVVLASACSADKAAPQVASLKSPSGSSSGSAGAASLSPKEAQLAYDKCMRAHGVNQPDADSAGGGSGGGSPIALSPATLKADQACEYVFGGGRQHGQGDQDARKTDLKMAACMRKNGITKWPDPLPTGQKAVTKPGETELADIGGTFVLPASIDLNSPKVKQALKTCQPGFGSGTAITATGSAEQP